MTAPRTPSSLARLALLAALVAAPFACVHTTRTGGGESASADEADHDTPPKDGQEKASATRRVTPRTDPGHPKLAASPDELLSPDARGQLTRALQAKGYLRADAKEGTKLGGAVRAFQKDQGLAETGFPDHETLARLGVNPADADVSLDPANRSGQGGGADAGTSGR